MSSKYVYLVKNANGFVIGIGTSMKEAIKIFGSQYRLDLDYEMSRYIQKMKVNKPYYGYDV